MSDEGRKLVANENSFVIPFFPLMKLNLHQMILNTISRCAPLELRVKIYILLHYHTNWRKKPHMHGRHGHAVNRGENWERQLAARFSCKFFERIFLCWQPTWPLFHVVTNREHGIQKWQFCSHINKPEAQYEEHRKILNKDSPTQDWAVHQNVGTDAGKFPKSLFLGDAL